MIEKIVEVLAVGVGVGIVFGESLSEVDERGE